MLEDSIYKAINSYIDCNYLDVTGDGRHFDAVVVSNEFMGKTPLERHRVIYSALGDMMKDQVHALSMKLYTINEWGKLNG
ncbi:MAG: BolA/IbaG family iron-sulfur metabolism protein [Proteobacteria bacterium]|jgi:acid stress-induced BolA-like protein IbaG/YrbA|nr:BolA/IbaG family iron-sulfur metabolism protein [Pseudomonadota bacterium]